MEEIIKLRQEYKDSPCFETRQNLASRLIKEGRETQDRAEKISYFSQAVELFEENYRKNPQYETRRLLCNAYAHLAEYSETSSISGTVSEAKRLYTKVIGLYEINVSENPCVDTRLSLSRLYRRMIFIIDDTTPEGLEEVKQLYHKKLLLDETNYSEKFDKATIDELGATYNALVTISFKEKSPDAVAEREKWLTKALSFREKNFRKNPHSHFAKMALVKAYNELARHEKSKGTPEGKEKADLLQKKINEIIDKPSKAVY